MKVEVRDENALVLVAEDQDDRYYLERVKKDLAPRDPYWWFRGSVNRELIRKMVELEAAGKL